MASTRWSRRRLLHSGVQMATAATVAQLVPATALGLQVGSPQPLNDDRVACITTTADKPWQATQPAQPAFSFNLLNLTVGPDQLARAAKSTNAMEGFGACFNELGWTSLCSLKADDRERVLHELFDPTAGARFIYCRMPIGANDFAREAYTYDETPGDFDLHHFSLDHDKDTLIPFIKAAQRHQPGLRLWASPWTPPSWMKRNNFYAEAKGYPGLKDNGIRPDQIGHEGEDMFRQDPRYLQAYARYFGCFIDGYREQGIPVGMVMPQNEFNSAQNFPSCTWTPQGLARFLAFLGPEMRKRNVEIFFGTLERGDPQLLETVLNDPTAGPFLQGVGVQWAGKNALPAIHARHPNLRIFQSEQECGDGSNGWDYTSYCWQLMKTYFRNGARGWMYWNISLPTDARSTWGWAQNSLITVNTNARTFHYNHDFYLLKHLTHFVDVGAKLVDTIGTCDDALAFLNPDGTVVLLVRNAQPHTQRIQVQVRKKSFNLELAPDSISTAAVKA